MDPLNNTLERQERTQLARGRSCRLWLGVKWWFSTLHYGESESVQRVELYLLLSTQFIWSFISIIHIFIQKELYVYLSICTLAQTTLFLQHSWFALYNGLLINNQAHVLNNFKQIWWNCKQISIGWFSHELNISCLLFIYWFLKRFYWYRFVDS